MVHYLHNQLAGEAATDLSGAAGSCHTSPLNLPEILEEVLSYLTHRQIRRSILLVCRQWNTVGRSAIPSISTWYQATVPQYAPRVEELLNPRTDGLCCIVPKRSLNHRTESTHLPDQEYWTLLETTLISLPRSRKEKIKAVIMKGDIDLELNLYPLLPIFCRIKELRLENIMADMIQLDTILRLCPHLSDLYIDFEDHMNQFTGTIYLESPNKSLPSLTLQSLTLRRFNMDITILEHILLRCHNIRRLRLIDMAYRETLVIDTSAELIEFFNKIAIACPQLRSLHFSPSNIQPNRISRNLVESIFTAFPNLRTWGTGINNVWLFMHQSLQEHTPRHLTTLEISNTKDLRRHIREADVLHRFLCVAPNLLHLHVEGVVFGYPEICILNDILPTRNLTLGETSRVWACRNLRTLKFAYQDDNMAPEMLHRYSRTTFAYIAHVCPKLLELKICHDGLDFSLEGGFCLLSSLRNLGKIEISSSTTFGLLLTRKDFDWFSTEKDFVPWKDASLIQRMSWQSSIVLMKNSREANIDQKRLQSIARKVDQSLRSEPTTIVVDEEIHQIQKASSLENVANVLDQLRKADDRCWPFLETLQFTWTKLRKLRNPLPPLVRQLRPELDHEYHDQLSRAMYSMEIY